MTGTSTVTVAAGRTCFLRKNRPRTSLLLTSTVGNSIKLKTKEECLGVTC